jgi:short-subunit dehydrogenase
VLLRNRWIVISGGSSGIGFELAQQLIRRGNRITVVADDAERLRTATLALNAVGCGAVEAIRCDIGAPAQIDDLVQSLLAEGKAPDVLVNNAGFATYRPFEATGIDEIERLIGVNLVGHIRLTKGLLTPMVARRSGAICFITSIAGRVPITPNATYCAAKHGMMGFAEAIRYELRRFGIEVTTICPGRVETAFFDHPTFRERTRGPENRSSVSVDRVAGAIVQAIERGNFVTYVPTSLGIAAWLYEALPVATRPLYSRLMGARNERLYADLAR